MEIKLALKVNDKDNVATIFANGITDGTEVEIRDKKGNAETVTVIGDVPYGHKIAVRDIKKGELINKYGEEIGIATKDIKKGEYVHVHNLDSMRGRGDWAKEVQMSSQDLKFGKKIIDTKLGSRAAMHAYPFFEIGLGAPASENTGDVLMGTIGWTGNYRFTFEVDNAGNLPRNRKSQS